jgi:putative 4-mercaptohistidine N1-methyltranferase
MMGIEHRNIHLETSSVLIRQLPLEDVRVDPFWKICTKTSAAPDNELLDVTGGRVRLGKSKDSAIYGWDNEYGRHEREVPAFRAARYLTSNGEFRDFVDDGGYREQRWWTEEGWGWREFRAAEHPLFWRDDGAGGWRLRLMLEEIPLPWDWPVEVNYLEAKAFCNWKAERSGRPVRLPTEEEWYRLHEFAGVKDVPDWDGAPGNIHLEGWASPCPVTEYDFGGFYDVVGNVWQWTETPITGFQGFEVHPLYDDFSTPTFDTKHNLIKGGSWISTGNEATKDARYAFRRHFFQHAGFRYIESEHPVEIKEDVYETDQLLAQYCEFHWGDEYFGVPNYPRACAEICLDLMRGRRSERALDLGCAVGRSSFELARGFERVTGLDFSARFVRIADEMVQKGYIQYVIPDEGQLVSYRERGLEDFALAGSRGKVEFFQADACNLKPIHTDYDLVFAGNLIDRLYSPRRFLAEIARRIRPGGLLVLTSPYTWLEEYTERAEWIGGFKRDGENLTTLDGLSEILVADFAPLGGPRDVPFVIRETRRKFQHTIAQLTAWAKI